MVFCLRLHPNLSANFRIRSYIKKLQAQNNFCLSINTLYEDLNTSDAVFYRSSAVGIEALRFKTYPIFYGDALQKGLDVLEGLSGHALTVHRLCQRSDCQSPQASQHRGKGKSPASEAHGCALTNHGAICAKWQRAEGSTCVLHHMAILHHNHAVTFARKFRVVGYD